MNTQKKHEGCVMNVRTFWRGQLFIQVAQTVDATAFILTYSISTHK